MKKLQKADLHRSYARLRATNNYDNRRKVEKVRRKYIISGTSIYELDVIAAGYKISAKKRYQQRHPMTKDILYGC